MLRLLVQQHEHADAGHEQHARRGDADGLVQIHHLVLLIFVLSRHWLAKAQRVRLIAAQAVVFVQVRMYAANAATNCRTTAPSVMHKPRRQILHAG